MTHSKTETANKNTPTTPKTAKRMSIFLTPFRSGDEAGEGASVMGILLFPVPPLPIYSFPRRRGKGLEK